MTRRLRARVAHVLLVVVGVVAVAYALTLGGPTDLRCRGAVMTPGSVCVKADGSAGQSYEQRLATRRGARPVVAGIGVLVVAFGAGLLIGDVRRPRPPGSPVEHAG